MGNCFRTASQTVDPVEARFKYQTPTIVTGKSDTAPGPSYYPCGVAIDENTHQIFVANYIKNRVVIFSETGEYIYQLGAGQLNYPFGVAIHRDSVYVSCCGANTVIRFSLTNTSHVRRIGGYGSNNGQFNSPTQLTTDSTGRVFIADTDNHRLCIYDPDLNHLYNITHRSMSETYYFKVSRDRLYVLRPDNNPCMHVLTLEGDKLHSLIILREGMDVSHPHFFCFDSLNNFVFSDYDSHSIRVFSPEGNLLHTIREGHQPRMFHEPRGVAVTPNGRFVCASGIENYGLLIFV